MKFLVLLTIAAHSSPLDFRKYEKAEANRVWDLYKQNILSELYLWDDKPGAVLIITAKDYNEGKKIVSSLPMVDAGLFDTQIIHLTAWPEMARLFTEHNQTLPAWFPKNY